MVAAVAAVALAGGCGWPTLPTPVGTSPAPSQAAPSTATATCADASLAPVVRTHQGTAGTQRFLVVLTNKSSRTCSILGYPVLVLRDGSGRVLPPAYPTGISRSVRLAAGRSATATFTVTPAACPTVPVSATAAVSPPGSSYSTKLPVRIPVCRPTISPVVG